MSTGITGPQSYSTNVQDSGRVSQGNSPSSATQQIKGSPDTINNAEGTQSYTPPDIDPIAALPKLPLPTDAKPAKTSAALEPEPTPDQLYNNSIRVQLSDLDRRNSKIAEQVYFVLTHPDTKLPRSFVFAKEMATQYTQKAQNEVRQATGNSNFTAPKPDTASADRDLAAQRNSIFEKLINDNSTLSPKEKSTLLLAYYHPEIATQKDLPLRLQLLLQKYTSGAEKLFDKTGVAPEKYSVPKNAEDFDAKVSYEFTNAFQEAANKNGADQKIMNYLRFRLNNPDGPMPPVPAGKSATEMEKLFEKTFADAQKLFSKETGFPEKFTPAVDNDFFNSVLQGRFEYAFDEQLAKQAPPLTEEQKTQLRTALGQQTENIPKEIKALLELLKGNAMAEVIKAYDLPPSWKPKSRDLNDPAVVKQRAAVETEMKGIKAAEEMLATMQGIVNQMPEGPDRMAYGSYLLAVGEALNKFSESILVNAASDAVASRRLTDVTRETEKDRIKFQQHDADEARKKEKSAAKMNKFLGVFMAIFMGPIGMALAIQKCATGSNFFEQLVTKVMELIEKIGGNSFFKSILKAIANCYLTVLSFVLGGPMMGLQVFTERFTASISDFLQALGVPKDKAEMIAMILVTTIMILAEIAIMIGSAGTATGALVGSFAQMATSIANIAKSILKAVLEVIKSLKSVLMEIGSIVAKASTKVRTLFMQAEKAADELAHALAMAQKAVSKAKSAPNTANIAKAERLINELTDKTREAQYATAKLAQQLKFESIGKPKFMNAARLLDKEVVNLEKTFDYVQKLSNDVSKVANSGVKSAQLLERRINFVIKGFSAVCVGMTVVSTGVNVGRELLLGQIAVLKAEMEADNIKIRAVIKAIRAVIDAIVDGIAGSAQTVKGIQETQASKFPNFNFVC